MNTYTVKCGSQPSRVAVGVQISVGPTTPGVAEVMLPKLVPRLKPR